MRDRIGGLRAPAGALLVAALIGVLAAGCGSSSTNPAGLLRQTFSNSQTVSSGTLSLDLTLNPTGSSTLSTPISFKYGGPFQSRGAGKPPATNFTISLGSSGAAASLGILSTGSAGYFTLQGTSYQMPASTYRQYASGIAQFGAGGGAGSLSKLGIDPLRWVTNPKVIGNESVGGTDTTHVHSGINVAAFLSDLNTLLGKASSLGISAASKLSTTRISDATRTRIASTVKNPTFDVWTASADKTVRKLAIALTLPVTGNTSQALGGLTSAGLSLTISYGNVNQPQTITAPTKLAPYSQFTSKVTAFFGSLRSSVGSVTGSSGSGSSGSGTSSAAPPATGTTTGPVSHYTECIAAAGSDVSKMQQCASLIGK